ncbi:MAG: triacylglycerol lipase [Psychrobacter sp.]|nr:triacylglycerol lipase [Psychrobacter sp.]
MLIDSPRRQSSTDSSLYQPVSAHYFKRISSLMMLLCLTALPAISQAGQYYNCANATGCKLIGDSPATSDYTKTDYPIVMTHGLTGWTRLYNILDYWYGIPETLTSGGSEVYITKTTAAQDTEFRGEELLTQVKAILTVTGKDKVNLFGHSHGGLDIRYVAAVAPDKVASVTAVSSPEQGSKMADWVIKMVTEGSVKSGYGDGEFNKRSVAALNWFNRLGKRIDTGSGATLETLQQQDAWAAVVALSTDYNKRYFNAKYPQAMPSHYCGQPTATKVNGVAYYSFSGVGTILDGITNPLDPSDYMLALTGLSFPKDDPNDGLVSSCSSRLGYVIRDNYKMNHLDSVNQVLGIVAWQETNPLAIYRAQVNRLKLAGL